jgi:PST family polysaccharide transporter
VNPFDRIRKRKGVQASLQNIGWLSADRITRMLGAVIVNTAVARYLGPSQFGLLNYGIAIFSLFNIMSNLGLDLLVVREIALDESVASQILGTGFALKATASVVTTFLAVGAVCLLEPHNRFLLALVALMSIAGISQAFDVVDYFFQAKTKSVFSIVPRIGVFVAASCARLVAVVLHLTLTAFAWIFAVEILLTELGLAGSYFLFQRPMRRWMVQLSVARQLLSESWPLLVSSVMYLIYFRSDQVLLGKLASKAVVGQYTAAIRLSEIWYSIPIIVCASVMPRMLKSREQDPARYYARLQRLYESMILVSVVVAICTQFAGPFAVRVLYGVQYASAAQILAIHIWTGAFSAVGQIGSQQFVQEKLTVSSMYRMSLGAVLNVTLNLLWIPRWGGIGSAYATLVAQGVACYVADAFDSRTRHIFRMKTQAYLRFWMLPRLIFEGVQD